MNTSDASGKDENREPQKRALFIGVCYGAWKKKGTGPITLRGPHKDGKDMKDFVIAHYGYKEQNTVMLLDTRDNMRKKNNARLRPTQENIRREMEKLVEGAMPGDQFIFHYSGHGDQVECERSVEEPDGFDEAIVPCDAVGKNEKGETIFLDDKFILDNVSAFVQKIFLLHVLEINFIAGNEHAYGQVTSCRCESNCKPTFKPKNNGRSIHT